MNPHQSCAHCKDAKRGECSCTASTRDHAAYMIEHAEFLAPDGSGLGGRIVAHPLFEQLLAAHVACLRVATPQEQQHIIDSELANRHHVAAKYLTLLSHLQTNSHPDEKEELTDFLVNYILLLRSFEELLHDHLHTQAAEAMSACQEIEQALLNLTGVSSSGYNSSKESPAMVQGETKYSDDEDCFDKDGLERLGINVFLPYAFLSNDILKNLREHVRRELKHELKKDYPLKLKELRNEILGKRRAGRLPLETSRLLKDWWLSHTKWPYPTEEEKAQLMEETGLELTQINNWFFNQRKRNP